ncbi:MAG TPA: hypothetical protein IGS37_05115 [Synechococcales cyanobacterium M55_K2018_004]|nr:hypothetical protein [Synechococcales cyanobacterium M55_K2018_004]
MSVNGLGAIAPILKGLFAPLLFTSAGGSQTIPDAGTAPQRSIGIVCPKGHSIPSLYFVFFVPL